MNILDSAFNIQKWVGSITQIPHTWNASIHGIALFFLQVQPYLLGTRCFAAYSPHMRLVPRFMGVPPILKHRSLVPGMLAFRYEGPVFFHGWTGD